MLEFADGAVKANLGVLGVLEKGGPLSRRFGYFYLYSGALGEEFGRAEVLGMFWKKKKDNEDSGEPVLSLHSSGWTAEMIDDVAKARSLNVRVVKLDKTVALRNRYLDLKQKDPPNIEIDTTLHGYLGDFIWWGDDATGKCEKLLLK